MKKNVGTADRVIRIIIGLALVSLFFLPIGNARWLGLIAIIPFATALVSFCPLYTLLGIGTRRTAQEPATR